MVEHQRQEALQKTLAGPPAPLFKEVRELVLRKCAPEKEKQVRAVFEKQPFGEIERLVTQKLSDVVKALAKEELGNERWLRLVAQLIGRSYEEMRVMILEFLDTDVFHLSVAHCDSFLDPLIESWDVDLDTFAPKPALAGMYSWAVPASSMFGSSSSGLSAPWRRRLRSSPGPIP